MVHLLMHSMFGQENLAQVLMFIISKDLQIRN